MKHAVSAIIRGSINFLAVSPYLSTFLRLLGVSDSCDTRTVAFYSRVFWSANYSLGNENSEELRLLHMW